MKRKTPGVRKRSIDSIYIYIYIKSQKEWNVKTCNNMIREGKQKKERNEAVFVCVSYICDGGSRALLELFRTKTRINAGVCGVTPYTLIFRVCVFTQTAVLTAH